MHGQSFRKAFTVPVFVLLAPLAVFAASPVRVYVASLQSRSVTLAWGTTEGTKENTIGRGARGLGEAKIIIGGRTLTTDRSWYQVTGLRPDTDYSYKIEIDRATIASASIRTWSENATSLTFFVIGDFGNGKPPQYAIASRMEQERSRLAKSGEHVRFIVSTGDNVYGGGAADRDWEQRFFAPYAHSI